jgi:hypothetical protein
MLSLDSSPVLVLAVDGLPGHAQPGGDVLPRPAGPTRGGDLLGLELLGQRAQAGDGPQAGVEVGAADGLLKVIDSQHGVSLS